MDPCFVVVGGGLAGATAALTLRTSGFDGRVVVVCEEEHAPYSRPLLSKAVVRGEVAPERTQLRPQRLWDGKDIELALGRAAVALDPDDSVAIRELLGAGRSLAVIGAGFVGAELAASAATLGTAVTVFEAAPVPLARLLPPALGEIYARVHRDRGVTIRTGTGIGRIEAESSGLRVIDAQGEVSAADAVVVAIGLAPEVSLAERAGLAIGDGVLVDEYCRTSAPDVYAAGDIANHPNPFLGRRVRMEHWQNAQHQGATAARNMLGADEPFAEVPWVWSDQYDVNLQITGLPEPGDEVVLRGDVDSLDFTALLLRGGELAAAVGVNRAGDVRAARKLIAARVSPTREQLADADLDLVALDPSAATVA
jgi:3-phenylpropionate/trans-cinnamate dioxygenase ferredoxin reductase subunit